MNLSASFVRKVVYLVLVGALLFPIMMLARPASRARSGEVEDGGGLISRMRQDYRLSQAQLSDIDPTSETMKLATLGLRGVAVNVLWMQANEQKKKEEWDGFEATLNALIKIQPNFVKVWEFQAHNLAYNISAEFDDFEYRYAWVKKGIEFLASGIPYNLREHKILDGLGDFTGMKIGNADEKFQFRRMFREDNDLHSSLARYIEPRLYQNPSFGYDHWKMAYWWYDLSERLVASGESVKRTNDLVYYMKRPSQVRHQAIALQDEFRPNEAIAEIWREAAGLWQEYGNRTIVTSRGTEITLNGLVGRAEELARYREQIDRWVPGLREQLVGKLHAELRLSPEDAALCNLPIDQVPDDRIGRYRSLIGNMLDQLADIDQAVFDAIPVDKQAEARPIQAELERVRQSLKFTDQYQGTSNYLYWVDRYACEYDPEGFVARQGWFDAEELRRKSVFDDERIVDPETRVSTTTREGALSAMFRVFRSYAGLMKRFPTLETGDITESLMDSARSYHEMLKQSGLAWPSDFPMQALIDRRKAIGDFDRLPVSEGVVDPYATAADPNRKLDNVLLRPESRIAPARLPPGLQFRVIPKPPEEGQENAPAGEGDGKQTPPAGTTRPPATRVPF